MCGPCDAAKERREAAETLRAVCENRDGIETALKAVFKLEPLEDEWLRMARKFDFD